MTLAESANSVSDVAIGGLPEGWVGTVLHDVTVRVDNLNPQSQPGRLFGYVDISSVDNRNFRIKECKRFRGNDAPSRARRPVQPGDVLFSNVRTYLRNIAMVPDDFDAQLCSTGFTVLRPNEAIIPSLLFYYVLTDELNAFVTPQQTGSNYPATNDRIVLSAPIPLPPLAEQRRIVEKVEQLLARVDAARERQRRVPTILKRFRQSVLATACSGRLTADWREGHPDVEPASVLLETLRRASDQHSARTRVAGAIGDHDEDELPDKPESWIWTTLGDCFAVKIGATPSRKEPTYWGGQIPWVSSGEVQFCRISETRERITTTGLENSSTQLNPAGSVLLGMIGEGRTRGQAAILEIDACNNQNSAAIWVSKTPVPPEFAYYWLMSRYEETRGRGAGNEQPALNKARVQRMPLPLPPLEEQREIVRRIEALFKLADAIERRVATAALRAERMTQAILAKAFRGELVPTEAELARREGRDYEPASALLERIQRERASL